MLKNIILVLIFLSFFEGHAQKEFYELRVYELSFGKPAEILHTYLEKALLPALNRQQINHIGVFEEVGDPMPRKIFLLIPHSDASSFHQSKTLLEQDAEYHRIAQEYDQTPQEEFPFGRYTSSLHVAFDGLPKLVKPPAGSSIFELRTYESYNEDALRRKVKMFNDSEFKIFDEVGLHSVFFGERVSGPEMPCLTYMLAFKDMQERDANWAKFGPHPEWQRIIKLQEYANTVSNISRVFLKPLSYSQL